MIYRISIYILIVLGADVNMPDIYGKTALIQAVRAGHAEIVKLLINAGIDVNIKSDAEWTPLIFASRNGHTEIVELLKAKGAK